MNQFLSTRKQSNVVEEESEIDKMGAIMEKLNEQLNKVDAATDWF